MDRPGEKLKRARERLKLTYREVERASQTIAHRRGSDEFAIALSRLADIENKGTLPTIYRLYTLCAIYRLDLDEVLRWYGVPREHLPADAIHVRLSKTHVIQFADGEATALPHPADREIDLTRTTLLNRLVNRWGRLPFHLLEGSQARHRYGLIGLEDWSLFPVLHPGSLVVIDENRRKIAVSGWTNEYDRPIYFLEHRDGYVCGWCTLAGNRLVTQPHPSSQQQAQCFEYPNGIEVLGQVIGAAMMLDRHGRHRVRT
jgi:transcriptional regulator with XRE-family HTH domain